MRFILYKLKGLKLLRFKEYRFVFVVDYVSVDNLGYQSDLVFIYCSIFFFLLNLVDRSLFYFGDMYILYLGFENGKYYFFILEKNERMINRLVNDKIQFIYECLCLIIILD